MANKSPLNNARVDIVKNSREDKSALERWTRSDYVAQFRKDFMSIRSGSEVPFYFIRDYPFKKRSSDSDIIQDDGSNVDEGSILIFGKLRTWRSDKEKFRPSPMMWGICKYIKAGVYLEGEFGGHLGFIPKRRYKAISERFVREALDPIANYLKDSKTFVFYETFPSLLYEEE